MSHHCHAMNCGLAVPPRMHMCRRHWSMVPKPFQDALWVNYRRGQENSKTPTAAYLRAAANCIGAVARAERWPDDEVAREVGLYESWAERLESA